MYRVRRERGLGEARQDQLELSRICRDVADREDARTRCRAGGRIDAHMLMFDVHAPSGERAEIGRKAKKRQQAVGLEAAGIAGQVGDDYRRK
jgi:hypothetical protein